MQKYPVRSSNRAQLQGDALERLCAEHFERAVRDGDAITTSFGAIETLRVWGEGKELAVDVRMNPKVDNAIAAETIGRYNRFLEAVTGYTAKERASKLRKAAGKGGE